MTGTTEMGSTIWAVNNAVESGNPELAAELAGVPTAETAGRTARSARDIRLVRRGRRLRVRRANRVHDAACVGNSVDAYLDRVVNPAPHLAPRAHQRGALTL